MRINNPWLDARQGPLNTVGPAVDAGSGNWFVLVARTKSTASVSVRSANYRILACALMAGFNGGLAAAGAAPAPPISISVAPANCSYKITAGGVSVLTAGIAAKVDRQWLHSPDYPKCAVSESDVNGYLGPAHQWVVEYSGLRDKPDLGYTIRSYVGKPLADVQAVVYNTTGKSVEVEDIRSVEAGKSPDLGGPMPQARVLSDSFSNGRPPVQIFDITPDRLYRGFGSQLIYNRQSHKSFFVGALSSDRFLTILRLQVKEPPPSDVSAPSYTADSTGTTESGIQDPLRNAPEKDRIELSLPISPGGCIPAERLLIGVDTDPHRQLETYGKVIRLLHHPRPPRPTPIGWWSWTAYYSGLSEGAALTNAKWLAQNLEPMGYKFFHIDEGYQYARGEYATADATLFPHGLGELERRVTSFGLTPGIWTAPFEVDQRSWVYRKHSDWLLHNAEGQPITIGSGQFAGLHVLDVTNPGAQQYLRHTYSVMSRDWRIRYFKLDFMDDTAIEGYYYKPHTTALQAQRIGLEIIRDTVGNSVLIDKDGSPMLNPVGYVDEGRISRDTGHAFAASKEVATGIASRYYMNHNFFTSDPDAFTVSTQTFPHRWHGGKHPLTLDEAKVSIALAAVSGGMFEIGDDLPTLGSEPKRLALIKNPDLLDMAKLGRASIPVDLMDYLPEDEQPSIFYLRENRQSILTIFNWTNVPRTHTIHLPDFHLPAHNTTVINVFTKEPVSQPVPGTITVDQPAHSVRVLKLRNTSLLPPRPVIVAKHVTNAPKSR